MGSHARMLVALGAALVFSIAGTATAGAATVTVRAEIAQTDITRGLIDRTPVTLTPGGPLVNGCASDSAIAALSALATGDNLKATTDPDTKVTTLDQLKGIPLASVAKPADGGPSWTIYVGGGPVADACAPLTVGGEVLAFLRCSTATNAVASSPTNPCFTGRPLMLINPGGNTDPNGRAFTQGQMTVKVTRDGRAGDAFKGGPAMLAQLTTDESEKVYRPLDPWPADGTTNVDILSRGDHWIYATETVVGSDKKSYRMVPDRMPVCSSDGHDGFCGTTAIVAPPPMTGVTDPGPCTTNGHDGECGTVDTSGPPTTLTTIKNGQVFARRKGPSKIAGTIAVDRNGVGGVRFRLTRTTTARVAIKPKKKSKAKSKKKRKVRYKTVKRCTYWSHDTLLLEKAKGCGPKYGKWIDADVTDVPTDFSYNFEMKLPSGKYTLEVLARDANGFTEDVAAGRNVLTFTVK